MSKKKLKLDSYHYHEAIDRTYLAINFIEENLTQHPVYHKHIELKTKIDEITSGLVELYQLIGNLDDTREENEKDSDTQ